ncbi:MAG: hypothetical protein ABI876_06960 [Bacteroidota bacterium]
MNQSEEQLQVIIVDQEHMQDGSRADTPVYTIGPADGIMLDASAYVIRTPAHLKGRQPNMIQLIVGKNEMYGAEWRGEGGRYVLDQQTLRPLYQSKPFAGFISGQHIVLAIVQENPGGADGRIEVYPMWYSMVNVR